MPDEPAAAPRITRLEWGEVELDFGETFEGAKLWPGGARAEVLRTERAVERYNELREEEPAGALIHSTC